MASALDLSLDDLIRQKKNPPSSAASRCRGDGGRGNTAAGGSGGGGASGPTRRIPKRRTNRLNPYPEFQKAPDSLWQHDLYTDEMEPMVGPVGVAGPVGGRSSEIELGTKLFISNLDYGVSDEDIKELFSKVGTIKRYSINYDRSGRSKGSGEVVFARRVDALAAVQRYDSVLLDGKPMKVEIVIGTDIEASLPLVPPIVAAAPLLFSSGFGNFNAFYAFNSGGSDGGGGPSGGGGFGAGAERQGRGRNLSGGGSKGKRKGQVSVSAAELDAELERYHASATQTS